MHKYDYNEERVLNYRTMYDQLQKRTQKHI